MVLLIDNNNCLIYIVKSFYRFNYISLWEINYVIRKSGDFLGQPDRFAMISLNTCTLC